MAGQGRGWESWFPSPQGGAPRWMRSWEEVPRGHCRRIHAVPEEAGVVELRIRKNEAEPSGVLNPEQDEGEEKSFSPGGEDVPKKESGLNGPASELNTGRRRRGGEAPINTEAETAEDVREKRRSGQTGHVLRRTWPSQVRATAVTGDGEA
ncbi:hypothetical protein NDU88_006203 [Pleurodeles waltl]|uniref:Uncharacterized protein n=1 Tax=Pleurodeles waltl TaxID=8319 RepID=A0AAV7VQ44_PLEWA|nr:hypothetical protein NDU88_006203 [Pleurodeles waltl]